MSQGIYDARSRVLVHLLGVYLGIVREKIDELENQIAEDLQDNDEDSRFVNICPTISFDLTVHNVF